MLIFFEELEKLKGRTKKIHFSFPIPDIIDRPDVLAFTDAEFTGEVRYAAGLVEVMGEIRFQATMSCGRCLQQFEETFQLPFHERFLKDRNQDEEEYGDEIHRISEESFDLAQYAKEEIFLAIPYVPLCRVDCKGLCPTCGANLNEQQCGCSTERIDPRLADLAKWFEQEQGK